MVWSKIDDGGWHRQIRSGDNMVRGCLGPVRRPAERLASGGAWVPRVWWCVGGRGRPMGLVGWMGLAMAR